MEKRMPAYIAFIREEPVRDEEALGRYSASNRENAGLFVEKYGLKPLSVYGASETLEGDQADGVVLLEFRDMETARAWYESPEYQAAIPDRHKGARYRAIMFEGL
jgi:uncharacterized protein (DUF1330 family)